MSRQIRRIQHLPRFTFASTNFIFRPIPLTQISPASIALIRGFHNSRKLWNNLPQFGPEPKPSKFKITKDKLLAQASGPLSRLLIHIKWPLKRSNKPFSIDDVSTFFSWLVMGNVLWIVLGTTTFGLVTMYSLHTFESAGDVIHGFFNDDDSETSEKKKSRDDGVAAYLTSSILSYGLGVKINFFKGNVLPEFNDGKLIFKNLEIISLTNETGMKFDCEVRSLSLSLSFGKWYDGNGLIDNLEIFGLTGKFFNSTTPQIVPSEDTPMVFRRYHDSIHFQYDMNDQADIIEAPKRSSRIDSNYEMNSVKIHDSSIEIYDSDNSKPLKISIFNCDIPKLTGKTLLIDFFNAKDAAGSINDSMFTIHKKQDPNTPMEDEIIRFKIDGIDIGKLTSINAKSRFNWIFNGKAEVTADIKFPNKFKENSLFNFDEQYKKITGLIGNLIKDIGDVNEAKNPETDNNDDTKLMKGALHAIYETFKNNDNDDYHNEQKDLNEYVLVNATIRFNNLKASLPKELPLAQSSNVPFITLHDLRALIAYINKLEDNISPIVVKTTVIEKLSNLYNFEKLTDTKIFDVIVSDIYDEFLKMVKLDEKRIIEEKSSLWSHSIASQLLLLGLGVIV